MKISVMSDLHFGFGSNSEIEMDSFDNAEEAIERSLDSDLIIIGGDIFDVRLPKTHTWANALRILSKPLLVDNPRIKLVSCTKKLNEIVEKRTLRHLPVIALHGNHERRARDELNTVQALENAGLLVYLNLDTIVFEKDGIKVAIHGMSNVPERYAKDVLHRWSPKPLPGCINILLLHQSIEPYVFSPLEPPTLSLDSMPGGFDIIINGHLHGHLEEDVGKSKFFMPGSTVITQFEKNEAESKKGFYEINLSDKINLGFVPFGKCRRFFYEDVQVENSANVVDAIESRINKILSEIFYKKPVIRFRLLGSETKLVDKSLIELENRYRDEALLMFSKKLAKEEVDSKLELLRNLVEQKMSIEDIGMSILDKNLEYLGFEKSFDTERLFHLLSDGNIETAMNILTGRQKTLL